MIGLKQLYPTQSPGERRKTECFPIMNCSIVLVGMVINATVVHTLQRVYVFTLYGVVMVKGSRDLNVLFETSDSKLAGKYLGVKLQTPDFKG